MQQERDEEERPPEPPVCPVCESPNRKRNRRLLAFVLASVIAAMYGLVYDETQVAFLFIAAAAVFAVVTDRWVCEDCGATWK